MKNVEKLHNLYLVDINCFILIISVTLVHQLVYQVASLNVVLC
jgi:hypothetical protein